MNKDKYYWCKTIEEYEYLMRRLKGYLWLDGEEIGGDYWSDYRHFTVICVNDNARVIYYKSIPELNSEEVKLIIEVDK